MASISSSNKGLSYAFCYGLMGGQRHIRKLGRLMRQRGYVLKPAAEADIVIAHSAGCWLIPAESHPKLVMYVGMPLNNSVPRQTMKQAKQLMLKNSTLRSNLNREIKSIYYGLTRPRRNWRIIRMAKAAKPVLVSDALTIFIANRHDPWPQSAILRDYLQNKPWAFISLPGAHDDISHNSERYVEIIDHYAKLLA